MTTNIRIHCAELMNVNNRSITLKLNNSHTVFATKKVANQLLADLRACDKRLSSDYFIITREYRGSQNEWLAVPSAF